MGKIPLEQAMHGLEALDMHIDRASHITQLLLLTYFLCVTQRKEEKKKERRKKNLQDLTAITVLAHQTKRTSTGVSQRKERFGWPA